MRGHEAPRSRANKLHVFHRIDDREALVGACWSVTILTRLDCEGEGDWSTCVEGAPDRDVPERELK